MGSRGGGMHQGTALNCVFSSNIATWGAGMYKGVARHCSFVGNQGEGEGSFGSSGGGGLSEGAAYQCSFVGNYALCGGGIANGAASGCLFVSNSAYVGGAAFEGTLINCTLIDNNHGSTAAGGFIYNSIIYNSVFYDENWSSTKVFNSCGGYSLINGVNGNTTNAPMFVDAANGDFRLQSNSPCINWGNNAVVSNSTDLAGNPRIVEGVVDMGAYEYQGVVGLAGSDSDGISDDWERQHGGNQNPESVCSNGVNTIHQAYIAGLNPNDPNSRFSFSVEIATYFGNILRWQRVSGREYTIYYSTNLVNGFLPLIDHLVPGESGVYIDTIYNGEPRYYKIDIKIDDNPGDNVTPPSPFS